MMSLVVFSSKATGPLYMFKETVEKIFKLLDRSFTEEGAFSEDELDRIIEVLNFEYEKNKTQSRNRERAQEEMEKKSSYGEELDLKEEQKRQPKDRVEFFQRIAPLLDLLRRAKRHHQSVLWGEATSFL